MSKYRIPKEALKKLLELRTISQIARSEEVSYNTVRNWAISDGLIVPKKTIKKCIGGKE